MITSDHHINLNRLTLAGISFVGLIGAVSISLMIVGGKGNPIAILGGIVGAMFFIVGAVAPRVTLYWMIPITFGLDFLKRLLIIFTNISWNDVAMVLAVAPLAAVGVFVGCVLRRIFIRRRSESVERVLFVVGIVLAVLGSISALKESGLVEALKIIANNSVYYFLPWALLQCFKTRAEIERFLKLAVVVAIPVSLYGIYQFFFGLQDFEIRYVKTGYAMNMAATVFDIRPRPFSTMSSPQAYSATMSFMQVIAFCFAFRRDGFSVRWFCVFLLHFVAVATSMSRGGFLTGLGMLIFAVSFSSRKGTFVAYGLATVFFVLLIANAETLLDRLEFWQQYLPSDKVWQEQAFRITTISNRLMGYKNVLLKPSTWPLIANPLQSEDHFDQSDVLHSHDLYSQLILKIGIIPVAIGACFGIYFAIKVHSAILRLPAGYSRNLGAGLLAILIGFVFAQSGGSGISVFPLNYWVGVFSGLLVIICFRDAERVKKASLPAPLEVKKRWRTRLSPKEGLVSVR